MSIQVNTGANAVNWETILSQIGDVQKTTGADGKELFTITTVSDGETRTMTVSIPDDLELPETINEGTLNALVSKLESSGLGFTPEQIAQMKDAIVRLNNEAAQALNEVSPNAGKKSLLFDIYALMALMIEVAQTQRDAAREMRTAQNQAIQKSIQDQADQQRSAALAGMIVGIVCGVVGAAVSIGLMAAQGASARNQANIMKQSGADASKMQLNMMQKGDTTAHASAQLQKTVAKVGNETATRVGNEFDAKLNNEQIGSLGTKLNDAQAKFDAAKAEVGRKEANLATQSEILTQRQSVQEVAQNNFDTKNARVQEAQTRLETEQNSIINGEEPGARDARINQAKTELDAAKAARDTAQAELNTANSAVEQQTAKVNTAQQDLGLANDKLTAARDALNTARNDYAGTVKSVADDYKTKYQEAVDRMQNPPEGTTKEQLANDVSKARNDMEMAFAKEAELLSSDRVTTPKERSDFMKELSVKNDTAIQHTYQRTDFKAAESKMGRLIAWNTVSQAFFSTSNQVGQSLSAMKAARATAQGAETQKEEEMLDQTKDLFQQEQKLIDQVVQLCQAVIQAESQSMRDAIQV